MTGKVPYYQHPRNETVILAIWRGERPLEIRSRDQVRPEWQPDLWILIQECWHDEPARRPNMSTVARRIRVVMNQSSLSRSRSNSTLNGAALSRVGSLASPTVTAGLRRAASSTAMNATSNFSPPPPPPSSYTPGLHRVSLPPPYVTPTASPTLRTLNRLPSIAQPTNRQFVSPPPPPPINVHIVRTPSIVFPSEEHFSQHYRQVPPSPQPILVSPTSRDRASPLAVPVDAAVAEDEVEYNTVGLRFPWEERGGTPSSARSSPSPSIQKPNGTIVTATNYRWPCGCLSPTHQTGCALRATSGRPPPAPPPLDFSFTTPTVPRPIDLTHSPRLTNHDSFLERRVSSPDPPSPIYNSLLDIPVPSPSLGQLLTNGRPIRPLPFIPPPPIAASPVDVSRASTPTSFSGFSGHVVDPRENESETATVRGASFEMHIEEEEIPPPGPSKDDLRRRDTSRTDDDGESYGDNDAVVAIGLFSPPVPNTTSRPDTGNRSISFPEDITPSRAISAFYDPAPALPPGLEPESRAEFIEGCQHRLEILINRESEFLRNNFATTFANQLRLSKLMPLNEDGRFLNDIFSKYIQLEGEHKIVHLSLIGISPLDPTKLANLAEIATESINRFSSIYPDYAKGLGKTREMVELAIEKSEDIRKWFQASHFYELSTFWVDRAL